MPRLSKWTVEALLLSDDLAKLIEANSRMAADIDRDNTEGDTPEKGKATVPLLATAKVPTSKLEVGSYTVLCTGIIEDALPDSKFNPEVYRLLFDVEGVKDEEGGQATTDAICSRTFSPKSKLWGWLVAFGLKPEVGKVMDLESVIGRRAMAVVEANGDYTRVGNLVPLPRGAQQPVEDVPFDVEPTPLRDALAEAAALATIVEDAKKIGFSMKEITDLAQTEFGKPPKDLDAGERERFKKVLGV